MARKSPTPLKDKRYKDAPRYQAIYGYEDDFKDNFKNALRMSMKEVVAKLKRS